jgi:hypothetical protein
MTNAPTFDELVQLVEQLSPGDLSVLELGLREPSAELLTMPGSANDTLWQQFAMRSWMTRKESSLPTEPATPTLLYEMTPTGRVMIAELFARLVYRRTGFSEELKEPYNSLYPTIARQIGEAAVSAGGRESDLVALLGAIVAEALKVYTRKENQEALQRRLWHVVTKRLQ